MVQQRAAGCRECGAGPADSWLDADGPLCDRCLGDRISARTGLPPLPDSPPPITLTGAGGLRHVLRYRLRRAPTGVAVHLREDALPPSEGYEFTVIGDHDGDVAEVVAAVRAEAEKEIRRSYLTPGPGGVGWQMAGHQVAGRLEYNPEGGPYRVVVDGRSLSWEQLGEALEPFEGWRFRLTIEDPAIDMATTPDHPS